MDTPGAPIDGPWFWPRVSAHPDRRQFPLEASSADRLLEISPERAFDLGRNTAATQGALELVARMDVEQAQPGAQARLECPRQILLATEIDDVQFAAGNQPRIGLL